MLRIYLVKRYYHEFFKVMKKLKFHNAVLDTSHLVEVLMPVLNIPRAVKIHDGFFEK